MERIASGFGRLLRLCYNIFQWKWQMAGGEVWNPLAGRRIQG